MPYRGKRKRKMLAVPQRISGGILESPVAQGSTSSPALFLLLLGNRFPRETPIMNKACIAGVERGRGKGGRGKGGGIDDFLPPPPPPLFAPATQANMNIINY